MGYRYMRILLFFDLPSITSLDHRIYRKFVKQIKKDGFYMLQESVYVKLALNQQSVDATYSMIKSYVPMEGLIMSLTITEKQFSTLKVITGEIKTDVINSDSRILSL